MKKGFHYFNFYNMGETFLHVMTLLAFRYVSVLNDFSKSLNLLLKFLFYS